MKKLLLPLLLLLVLGGCANPGSGPDGGPYDETPPKIVGMSPALGATGAKAKKVSIVFDEMIKVENAQEKVTVSPPQIEQAEIKTSGRRVTVEVKDSLKENTTYTVDFSDAIVDSNEGNPLGNFTYFFSTGEKVDSMEVSGYVLNAEDHEPVKGILVGLHSDLVDSAFTSKPFERVARTDSRGHFSIKGVGAGEYRIYALKDMDNDFKYVRGEMLAFSRETIKPTAVADTRYDTLWRDTATVDTIMAVPYTRYEPDDVVLMAFTESGVSRQLLKTQREPEWFKVYFTAPSLSVPRVEGMNFDAAKLMEERNLTNDTITYWLRDTELYKQDTLRVRYTYEATDDSTGVLTEQTDTLELVPRFGYEKRKKFEEQEIEKFEKEREKRHKRGDYSKETRPVGEMKIDFDLRNTLAPDQNIHFRLAEPAARFDTAGIHLYLKVDTVYQEARYALSRDSLSLLSYTLKGEWRPGQEYVLNVDSAIVTGLSGKVNNYYDRTFKIPEMESYASLFLLLPDADTSAVVQLIQGEKPVKKMRVRDGRADFFYLSPGVYYLRMFNDRNGNGAWDTGVYSEGKQAEEVYYFPSSLTLRANWDVEQTWRVKEVPLQLQKPRELVKQKEDKKKTPKNRNAERARQLGR